MHDERFRPSERLRQRERFRAVFERKASAGACELVVYVVENGLAWSRLGLSVGRRAGSAVARNRIKRRLREAFRRSKERLPKGRDIVCVGRAGLGDPAVDVEGLLVRLASKAEKRLATAQARRGPEPRRTPR